MACIRLGQYRGHRCRRRALSIGHREIRTLSDWAEVVEIDEQEPLVVL